MINWHRFPLKRTHGFPISKPILQERSLTIAEQLGVYDFNTSHSLLDKWKSVAKSEAIQFLSNQAKLVLSQP